MQNRLEYTCHKLFSPSFYYRQYEKDLPAEESATPYLNYAKRGALIALPFISLYQPVGRTLSLGMGSVRVFTTTAAAASPESLTDGVQRVMQLGLALVAVAGTLYNFTLGLYLTTGVDLLSNLFTTLERLWAFEYSEASGALLETLSSGIYLAIMMTGSLEVVLASLLLQAFVSFLQAREEWQEDRMPEALAKTLMGMIRLYQGNAQLDLISKRNQLRNEYAAFIKQIEEGRNIEHLYDEQNPLVYLDACIKENRALLEDADGKKNDFGSYFFGYGKQAVKGMNIAFREEKGATTLEFKVNHVFRDRLQKVITNLVNAPQEDLQTLLHIYGSHVEHISLEQNESGYNLKALYHLKLKGLGKITIGATKENLNIYDRVTVHIDKGKKLSDFHEALSFLNLTDALRVSAKEDIERMKMGHLFRIFCPKEATLFERSDPFFDLPLSEFKKEIVKRSPKMESYFTEWLPKMELREGIPGKMRWSLVGLADEVRKEGGIGLSAAITGGGWWWDDDKTAFYKKVASLLKMGMLSYETRDRENYGQNGLGCGLDYYSGGADSVYTQIVTTSNSSFNQYAYSSPIRILISPKVLETGTYQHHYDLFGTRRVGGINWWSPYYYLNRDNILDFTRKERLQFHSDNEVMIKERIPPEYFTGIVVSNQKTKEELLAYLREKEIIRKDELGREKIFSKLTSDFIHVGNTITDTMFA